VVSSRLSMIGSRALLFQVECPLDLEHQQRFWAIAEQASSWPGVREAVPGMTNVILLLAEVPRNISSLGQKLEQLWRSGVRKEMEGKLLVVDITYGGEGGPHLRETAQMIGKSIDEFVRLHTEPEYTVFAVGSHAGYCYLGGLNPKLETPRRQVPLTSLPGGSLSLAGLQTGISASTGPSGWNTVGSANVDFFNPFRDPPTLLRPGDRVRFKAYEISA